MLLSLVINLDSRAQNDNAEVMFHGTSNWDYLTDGIANKIKFLAGFEKEVIAYVDEHLSLPDYVVDSLGSMCDIVQIRKHTDEISFNDWNYHRALSLAKGDVVIHFDQDTACFTTGKEYVEELIGYLDNYKFISYPSHWTPNAVDDPSFGGLTWASTRFFICRKESLRLDELEKCIADPNWMYEKYGNSPRRCNWTEHYLAKINNNSVFYPPVELHKGAIFSWGSYRTGLLAQLNEMPYELVKQWIIHSGNIQYPCDIFPK